jgi:hypothetical protein
MATERPFYGEHLGGVLERIEKELTNAFGTEVAARFSGYGMEYIVPQHVSELINIEYTRWTQSAEGGTREVTIFPGGTWQLKSTYEGFDPGEGIIYFNRVVSRDNSGKITVEGDIPVEILETFLFETSKNDVSQYRSLLLKILNLFPHHDSKHSSLHCKFSSDGEVSFIGFPLTN